MNSVRLGEIVAALGGELRGDPAQKIARIAPLETAGGDAITFVAQPKLRSLLETSEAVIGAVAEARPHYCAQHPAFRRMHGGGERNQPAAVGFGAAFLLVEANVFGHGGRRLGSVMCGILRARRRERQNAR